MTDLTLISDLESATGPSRDLSDRVLLACGWRREVSHFLGGRHVWKQPRQDPQMAVVIEGTQPDPTARLDDVMALAGEHADEILRSALRRLEAPLTIERLCRLVCIDLLKARGHD